MESMTTMDGGTQLDRFLDAVGLPDLDHLVRRAEAEPAWYWPEAVRFLGLDFMRPWVTAIDQTGGNERAAWWVGGATNVSWLCAGRWSDSRAMSPAIIWLGEGGDARCLTYAELWQQVVRVAAALRGIGVERGDFVASYLPLCPEGVITILAASYLGAIAAPMYSGLGEGALTERLRRCAARVLVTTDRHVRSGSDIDMLEVAANASRRAATEHLLVVRGGGSSAADFEIAGAADPPVGPLPLSPEHPFLLLFTSGSTGRPKGVLHGHGRFPYQGAVELALGLDVRPDDRFGWITDLGWIMGPLSALCPLALGATAVLIEGHPLSPSSERLGSCLAEARVTHLGASPGLLRTLRTDAVGTAALASVESLRVLMVTGEKLPPDLWEWAARTIGLGSRPVLNLTGGTEIGGSILSGCAGRPVRAPGFHGPTPGMSPEVRDEDGHRVIGQVGDLVLAQPWPGRLVGFLDDHDACRASYWNRSEGVWRHGDRAIEHADGRWELVGRGDDVWKVNGRRSGPDDYEAPALQQAGVRAAAAVNVSDEPSKAIVVVAVEVSSPDEPGVASRVAAAIAQHVGKSIAPSAVVVTAELPRTPSGKLHRQAVAGCLAGRPVDPDELMNPACIEALVLAAAASDLGSPKEIGR